MVKHMTNDELRQIFEEIDPEGKISQTTLEELISALGKVDSHEEQHGRILTPEMIVDKLKEEMAKESDWKKKAALAAKLISFNLE